MIHLRGFDDRKGEFAHLFCVRLVSPFATDAKPPATGYRCLAPAPATNLSLSRRACAQEGSMGRSRGDLGFFMALMLGLSACATSGDIDKLNAKIDDLARRTDERTAAAEQRAAAAEQKAEMAASQAQAAAGQADAAARKSEAIFNKSVSKGGR
ncbi:MAG TPA: hypothetical protein VKF60_08020 [Myxococcota bacterium]|nr:hypothetical protein [Myxococcota bacterium]